MDAILKEPASRLIGMPVSDFCVQSDTGIYRAPFVIFLYEGVYLQTRLFVVPVWLVQESVFQGECSVKLGPNKPEKYHNLAC